MINTLLRVLKDGNEKQKKKIRYQCPISDDYPLWGYSKQDESELWFVYLLYYL